MAIPVITPPRRDRFQPAFCRMRTPGRVPDFGGPEVLTLRDMAAVWRSARDRPRAVVRLPVPGRIGRAFRRGLNTCPGHAGGHQTLAQFVDASP
jgi:uncharacterized protein YbjT (DUF2867 family)